MRVDLRDMTGRSPRCELGMCKNRSTISLGDATARGGMGRLLLCEDCAKQVADLIHNRPQISPILEPSANEEPSAIVDTPEPTIVEPTEPEESTEVSLEERTRAELMAIATEQGIPFGAKVTKTELLELLALHG